VELTNGGAAVKDKKFKDLLEEFEHNSKDYTLHLLKVPYSLKFNWPWINSLTLPTSILAGFYIYPSKVEIEFAERQDSEFRWHRGKLPSTNNELNIEWEEIGSGFALLVRPEDVGYRLKVTATPRSSCKSKVGPEVEAISKNDIQAGPGICPFETRHLFTENRLEGSAIRVASYNILADYYCDSDYTRTVLFPYCPAYALAIDYRKQLFLKEILGYNTDLLCMQEVDFKIFDLDLVPFLSEQGMDGIHNKKGTTPEGLACFYKRDRFEIVEQHALNISEAAKTHPACEGLWQKLQNNEKLIERISDRATTLQFLILRSKDVANKFIAVANTHLYFHPDADHVRLLQIGFSMILVEDLIKKFKESDPEKHQDLGLLFFGDFNSVPECGIFKLMTEKFVPDNFIDWCSNKEEAVTNVTLSQPFNMQSACGCPPYTNYTDGFKACLDYCFYQTEKFNVTNVVELPAESELGAHIAIPSVVFPSDHVAIIAELEFK